MSVEANVVRALRNDAAVTAICGDRIYADIQPQSGRDESTYPSITHELVQEEKNLTLTGYIRYTHTQMRINCMAHNRNEATALATAVDDLLRGYSGALHTTNVDFIYVQNVSREIEADRLPPVYIVIIDMLIKHFT